MPEEKTYRKIAFVGLGLWLTLAATGCTTVGKWSMGGWVANSETAERMAERHDRDMFIHFRDSSHRQLETTGEALQDPVVEERLENVVCCRMFRSYAHDRRYVAQFGVERAPALIYVRNDGTYHAREGAANVEEILALLDAAQSPGRRVQEDPWIPRSAPYRWLDDPQEALAESRDSKRPALFVFYRWMRGDWDDLEELLHRHEVYPRFANAVHCRLSSLNGAGKAQAQAFGIENWPALVIAFPDDTYASLELPTGYEQIARFAENTLGEPGRATTATAAASAIPDDEK